MKWTIGLPLVTAGLIAIDKHALGALPRNPSSGSADISDVGLFATAGAVGVLLIDGKAQGDSHAFETGVLGAEAMANSGVVFALGSTLGYLIGRHIFHAHCKAGLSAA
jgi:hypothetical protein